MLSFVEVCFPNILGSVFSHWNDIVLVKLAIFCSMEYVIYDAMQGNKIVTKIIALSSQKKSLKKWVYNCFKKRDCGVRCFCFYHTVLKCNEICLKSSNVLKIVIFF